MQKVIACCQAGAQATGCQIKYDTSPGYAEIIPNPTIARLFSKNMVNIGRSVVDPDPNESMGSTDMGDVSHLVPAIHPYLAVVPETVPGHSDEFREICITQAGRSAMLDAAKSLALTAIDLLTHPEFLTAARQELDKALATSSPNHTQPR
jgi:metal-dependent amidase/aminoacylase/carboxypeptidase family protein